MTKNELRDQYSRNMNTGMEQEHHICTKIMMNSQIRKPNIQLTWCRAQVECLVSLCDV